VSNWQLLFAHMSTMDIGETVTDDELMALLPAGATLGSMRAAFAKALKRVEEECSRSFDRVRLVGYRMVEPSEHENLARRQHRFAKRRLSSAHRKASSADRALLNNDERRRIDAIELNLARQQDMIHRLEARQRRTDERVATTEKDTSVLSDRVDRLMETLRRHGIEPEVTA
jgi:hypothetical protein